MVVTPKEEALASSWEFQRMRARATHHYLSAVCNFVKVVLTLGPTPVTAGRMTSAMPVAMSAYSIDVAALSSCKNLITRRTCTPLC